MGLGGNTPGTPAALARARLLLGTLLGEVRFSSLYRSAPQVDVDQEPFWNAAAAGEWPGTAESLLERLLMAEAGEGRARDPLRPKGPRILDLDLLVFGDEVRSSARLSLPHPGLPHRRFALLPLVEVLTDRGEVPRSARWAAYLGAVADQGVDRAGLPW